MREVFSGVVRYGSIGLLLLFCGYNLQRSTHRFDGIVGMTRKNGSGCYCHNPDPTPAVQVWIEGPTMLQPGETAVYTLRLAAHSTRTGGFNIASSFGTLQVADSLWTYWYEGEMTHAAPKPPGTVDTVSWQFSYVAPLSDGLTVDTLYSVGNSTNQDTMATDADHWNFGEDFLVTVATVTDVGTGTGQALPSGFVVHQNYPNPFNPATTLHFEVSRDALVKVTLYDVTGRFIGVVDEDRYSPGSHRVLLNADRFGLSSGVYFCRFEAWEDGPAPSATVVRKLALLR